MKPPANSQPDRFLVAQLATAISIISFFYYLQHGDTLLYGDAVAHINIARRVFDSRTPGLLQLGTVWLPLPHLLMIPLLLSDSAWQSGLGGSIPSLIAYLAAVLGIFRLVRGALSFPAEPDLRARLVAWFAAAVFAANPNLIYLQTTAMTEVLYLAFFIWSVVYLAEFAQAVHSGDTEMQRLASRSLVKCAVSIACAEATRYDGWFLAAATSVVVFAVGVRTRNSVWGRSEHLWRDIRNFAIIVVLVPALWFAYNGVIYRNPLEFANGPYSARAIEQRNLSAGVAPHPGAGSPVVAGLYFLKSAELNVGPEYLGRIWLLVALAGFAGCFRSRVKKFASGGSG